MRTFRPTVPRRSGAYGDKTRNRCEASRSAMVEARNARRLTFMYRVGSCPVLMPRSRGFADLRIAELRSCGVAKEDGRNYYKKPRRSFQPVRVLLLFEIYLQRKDPRGSGSVTLEPAFPGKHLQRSKKSDERNTCLPPRIFPLARRRGPLCRGWWSARRKDADEGRDRFAYRKSLSFRSEASRPLSAGAFVSAARIPGP